MRADPLQASRSEREAERRQRSRTPGGGGAGAEVSAFSETPEMGVAIAPPALADRTVDSHATVVGVIQSRALRHYSEGIRQYLVLRLSSVEEANDARQELRVSFSEMPVEKVVAPPGIRAHLYRAARELVARRLKGRAPLAAEAFLGLPWRALRSDAPTWLPVLLGRIRSELSPGDRELLELRFARELSPEELAFVLDLPAKTLAQRLDQAIARVRSMLNGLTQDSSIPLPGLLLEAFALSAPAPLVGAQEEGDDAPEPLAQGTVIGARYAVESRVGTGAFSDVYRARDTEVPGHWVAVKLLHQPSLSEAAKSNALRELHHIASVFHPSIVQFKDYGWFDGRLWFVMPWYEGETLEERLQRRALTRAEAKQIFEPLARALATMHGVGIRHQDVKPDNIFLARIFRGGREGRGQEVLPVLLDLGVAAKEAEMLVAGTPTYFAPEVAAKFASIEGSAPATSKADVFSLALSLRNALEPKTQDDVAAGAVGAFVEYRATHMPPMPESSDLQYLQPCFKRWLSLDPEERPSAEELVEELAVLTQPEERRERRRALLRWLVPLSVALAVMFVSVVYVLNARAERQKMAAMRARIAEAGLRADLVVSNEQRRELEEHARNLRQKYESGRLTRQQLAQNLARAEGRERLLRENLGTSQKLRRLLKDELGEAKEALNQSQRENTGLRNGINQLRDALAAQPRPRPKPFADQRSAERGHLGESPSRRRAIQSQSSRARARRSAASQRAPRAAAEPEPTASLRTQFLERNCGRRRCRVGLTLSVGAEVRDSLR